MERMTVKCDDRHWGLSFTVYDNAVPSRILEKLPIAIDRLAAYEDTGLEPEEVAQTKLALMGKALAEIKEFEGVPVNRMIELAQAEKDGRLVVLPPNDPLTLDELRAMIGSMVQCGSVDGQFFGRMLVGMNGCVICDSFDFSDYGKTWLAYRRKPEEGRT